MTQAQENPYNQSTHPKEYQQWYYQNVRKQKIEAPTPKPKDYFNNKQKYTKKQLEFNRMTRSELIDTIFTPQDEIDPNELMTYKTRSGHIMERTQPEAIKMARKEAQTYHNRLQIEPRAHRIIDFIDIIRRNRQFEATEAFTLLELGFRYYLYRKDMAYYWIKPLEISSDEDLETIIPRKTIMTIIPGTEPPTIDTTPEQTLWNSLKTALNALRTDWRHATDEAQAHLTHIFTYEGETHQYTRQSAIHDLLWQLSDTITKEAATKSDGLLTPHVETLPPIPI